MPAEMHNLFKSPDNPRAKIWRYMDFTKYVALLETSSLYFCRGDKLGDPFEGSTTRANYEVALEFAKETSASMPQGHKDVPLDSFEKLFVEPALHTRQRTYINCWHLNEGESDAMWKLYAQTNEAVAITSTFKRLYECLPSFAHLARESDLENNIWFGRSIHVGEVNYIDYHADYMGGSSNIFRPFLYKRKSFAHEQEVRAIYYGSQDSWVSSERQAHIDFNRRNLVDGVYIPVDLMQLVVQVYIAPTAPTWFSQLVGNVTRRYGLNVPVLQSDLGAEPVFVI